MLNSILKHFNNSHVKKLVVEEFLRLGFRIADDGTIYAGNIEVQAQKVARALSIDRRVVKETAKEIAENNELFQVFSKLEPRAYLGNAAKQLGLESIEVRANPRQKGIVSKVANILFSDGMLIRQIVADDPELYPDPVLTIILDKKLKNKTINKLRKLRFAESILIK